MLRAPAARIATSRVHRPSAPRRPTCIGSRRTTRCTRTSAAATACDGAILVVDASQGVEAQTLANVYLALDNDLEILPVLNKIDLPASDLDRTKKQIEEVIGIDTENAIPCSGKTGEGIEDILEQIMSSH